MADQINTTHTETFIVLMEEHERFAALAAIWLDAAIDSDPQEPVSEHQRDRYTAVGAAYAQLATAKAQAAQAVATHQTTTQAGDRA
ncbi:hypothetical protein [Couchioplanes azureus]|uniref:hypothetical protein n=1 Tax=Couchioplanes caeruleus TaxID=56438 RepID=UPI001671804C|nr:hypothetical protein [Couchioplanes caeruleus]GGQ70213.1 hypothetical protein GCM10010166_45090 [Couchioplanes caeruleus subsp. azureus]